MIKGILFDFNGTLFYDSDKHIAAVQEFFLRRGLDAPDAEDIVLNMFGKTNRTIFRDRYKKDATEEEILEYGREKELLYREACLRSPETFHLVGGAARFLDYLKANGIPYNLATGSPLDNVEFYFEQMGLGEWFSKELVVYDDGSRPGKPAPDMYIEAAKRIGLSPEECIVFEDAANGIRSARAAGAGAVYLLISDGLASPVSDELTVDGEIKDFESYKEILDRYEIIGKDDYNVRR